MIDLRDEGGGEGNLLVRRVSHAVMNDLAVVRLLLDSAASTVPPETAARLTKAAGLVGDVADLLGQLSALARPGSGPAETDLCDAVRQVELLLGVAAGPGATVQTQLPEQPVIAVVDVRRAQRALLADVTALGEGAAPGTTITVTVDGGAFAVSSGDVTART